MPFIFESGASLLHVVEVAETLIVYAQLELVSMLHYVKHVVSNVEGVLERGAELLDLEDQLVVLVHFLLACQV